MTWGEPFTVERLRGMMETALPEMRENSTVLWAADRIDELEAHLHSCHVEIQRLHDYIGALEVQVHGGVS